MTKDRSAKARAQRYLSHALVEVRRYKHIPIFAYSAVLLDLSTGGFKLEFTGETIAKPGNHYWLSVPLAPLGIYSPKRLNCHCECRWFDEQHYRMGGTFSSLTRTQIDVIEQLVNTLKTRGQL